MTLRHFLAVLASAVIGLVLSLLLGVLMGLAMAIYYVSAGMRPQQLVTQLDGAHLAQSIPFLLATLGIGAFAMLIAGFIAGWIARKAQTLTGFFSGILAVILSLPFALITPVSYPLWYNLLGLVVTIAPAAAGGYVAKITLGEGKALPPAIS